ALLGSADVSELLQPWGQDELYVLTAGMMPPNPAELLDSRAMGTLITRLSGEFDFVILDGPPLLPVADSLTLSKYVGRVLLVASVGEVRISELQEALRSLEVLDVPVNLVLNRVPTSSAETSGYYQAYSSRSQDVPPRHRRG
ncbi:chromosome partitioning protein, partial [Burkholderia multivorans]